MPRLSNIGRLATCAGIGTQSDLHEIANAAMVWQGDRIRWVGAQSDLPRRWEKEEEVDAGGHLVVPGLVDCHTHLCFGGWRDDEFARRCAGESYLEIAKSGGGILRTVDQTRSASRDELLARSQAFMGRMLELGVTSIEAKSGYGLDTEQEIKILSVYRDLALMTESPVVRTFLGAHTVPREFRGRKESYVDLVIHEMIPAVASQDLAAYCDVFVEEGAFDAEDARRIARAAKSAGLGVKLHADQLTDGSGAALAAELGAVSADHLEYTSSDGMARMAEAGVIGVLLPLASLYLGGPFANGRAMISSGVDVAVATDFNPGSAPSFHLPLAMTIACTMCGLTPTEALKGATLNAARAIGIDSDTGSLEVGKKADFVITDSESVDHWIYHFRPSAVRAVYRHGKQVDKKPAA